MTTCTETALSLRAAPNALPSTLIAALNCSQLTQAGAHEEGEEGGEHEKGGVEPVGTEARRQLFVRRVVAGRVEVREQEAL